MVPPIRKDICSFIIDFKIASNNLLWAIFFINNSDIFSISFFRHPTTNIVPQKILLKYFKFYSKYNY